MDDQEPTAWEKALAEHEATLTTGARVRVRLHGEYPMFLLKSGGQIAAHQPTEDGRLGVVSEIIRDDTACMFRVRFDEPFAPFPSRPEIRALFPSIPETTISEWLYTVTELIPLGAVDETESA